LGAFSGAFGLVAQAQTPVSPASSRPNLAPGTWTIAVVTASAEPSSKALLQSLRTNPWVVANADRVRLAEMNSDASGRPSTSSSTAVLVYQQGPRGPEMMGGRSGFAGADDVVVWVRNLVATSAESTIRDPNLTQANLMGKGLPSAQAESPSMQMPQPMPGPPVSMPIYPQTYAQPTLQPQTTTTFAVPATMVQAPQQQLVIQQPPPQVLFAPQTTPMVLVPQVAAAPNPNLYMMPNPVAAVPQPMMAVAPQPQPVQPMMTAPTVAQAQPIGPTLAGASLATSSFSVPASSTTSRVRVKGPGPVASALARFGERLTTLGRTRIETVQETRLETQVAQTPPGQFMTLSSTSASPVLTPQQTIPVAPPQLPVLPPPASPQSPQATPQSGHGRWH
jgi:hypothetical protein